MKRDIKKENNEIKKMWNNEKEKLIFEMLFLFKLIILEKQQVDHVYRSWVALVSSVYPLLTALFSKMFREK